MSEEVCLSSAIAVVVVAVTVANYLKDGGDKVRD